MLVVRRFEKSKKEEISRRLRLVLRLFVVGLGNSIFNLLRSSCGNECRHSTQNKENPRKSNWDIRDGELTGLCGRQRNSADELTQIKTSGYWLENKTSYRVKA